MILPHALMIHTAGLWPNGMDDYPPTSHATFYYHDTPLMSAAPWYPVPTDRPVGRLGPVPQHPRSLWRPRRCSREALCHRSVFQSTRCPICEPTRRLLLQQWPQRGLYGPWTGIHGDFVQAPLSDDGLDKNTD